MAALKVLENISWNMSQYGPIAIFKKPSKLHKFVAWVMNKPKPTMHLRNLFHHELSLKVNPVCNWELICNFSEVVYKLHFTSQATVGAVLAAIHTLPYKSGWFEGIQFQRSNQAYLMWAYG